MAIQANQLPETGFLRLWHIIGNPKAIPPIPAIIPVSRTTFLNGVKSGRYPQPVKTLGLRTTAWRVEDIRELVQTLGSQAQKNPA
jgi:predicted DNA-binding transcriptional regulator AlpA